MKNLSNFKELMNTLEPKKMELLNHPIYKNLKDLNSLRIFMEYHIFAVWDFMSLLKSLQIRLTCTTVPWVPNKENIRSARFINEIVLAEETDEIRKGVYSSHYDLYIEAMKEIGANPEPIVLLINNIKSCDSLESATKNIPKFAKQFVEFTFETSIKQTHEIAAAFLFGREELIPDMFRKILSGLDQQNSKCTLLKLYLERHIELDESSHVHLARNLLEDLCENDPIKWKEVKVTAINSIDRRIELWDSVHQYFLFSEKSIFIPSTIAN